MKGMENVLARIRNMPDAARKAAETAANQSGRNAVRLARTLVPVQTGALRASIRSRAMNRGTAIETRCPYAGVIEIGARNHPARPFLLPAARFVGYPAFAARIIQEALK